MADRAVIYARFSSHSQRDESIEDQVAACRREADADGFEVVRVYADRALSGTTDARPEFLRMISDAEKKSDFSRVYIWKTDRFARNRYDSAVHKARLRKCGVSLKCVAEHIPEGPEGILMESVLEGMAEWFSANLSTNVLRGMNSNAEKCLANGVRVYGYDIGPDGRYVVNEREGAVVRGIFEAYAAGDSVTRIAERYAHERKRGGSPIDKQFVSALVRNDRYAGVYRWGGHVTPGGVPAIVDELTWRKCEERLAGRKKRLPHENTVYLLAGILYDAEGNPWQPNSGRGRSGAKYTYYRCPATGASCRQGEMEEAAAALVAGWLGEEGVDDRIVELVLAAQDEAAEGEVRAVEEVRKALAANARAEDNAIELALKMGADDRITARIADLRAERADLEESLRELERSAPVITEDHVRFWIAEARAERDPRALIRTFVSKVVVDGDELSAEFVIGVKRKTQTPSSEGGFELSDLVGQEKIKENIYISVYPWGFAISTPQWRELAA